MRETKNEAGRGGRGCGRGYGRGCESSGFSKGFPIMRIFLLVRVPLRKESLGNRRTGVGMVGLVVLSEVVVVENLVMGKLVMENVLAGHMNAVVELGMGEYFFSNVHAYRQFTFVGYRLLGVKSEFSYVQK